jgi:hypothetical protein
VGLLQIHVFGDHNSHHSSGAALSLEHVFLRRTVFACCPNTVLAKFSKQLRISEEEKITHTEYLVDFIVTFHTKAAHCKAVECSDLILFDL